MTDHPPEQEQLPAEPEPEGFGDEAAGTDESEEVTNDPENVAAAEEIRNSTFEPASEGQEPEEG